MAQIIAEHWQFVDILPSMMARLKQHMLGFYAKKINLQAEQHFKKDMDYVIVECDELTLLSLLSDLKNNGCTDLHVYSNDTTTQSILEAGIHGQFRLCTGTY
jgi:hypothetical protein